MDCPKCGKEMEPGFLWCGRGPLIWTRNKRKRTLLTAAQDVLVYEGGIGEPRPGAGICRAYGTVTLSIERKESPLSHGQG